MIAEVILIHNSNVKKEEKKKGKMMLLPIACKVRSGSAPLPTHSTPAASQPPETSLGDNGLGYWRP